MSIVNKVLCTGLKTSCLGTSLKDKEATSEVTRSRNAENGSYSVNKSRLKEAIEPFQKLRSAARKWFNAQTLPGISDDLRIVPTSRLALIQEKFREYQEEDAALLANLRSNYYEEIEKDRLVLGRGFDASVYPSAESLGHHFHITLMTCNLPSADYDRIAGLSEEVIAKMKAEHDAMIVQIGVAARADVMKRTLELIQKIADKMSDANAKQYHDSTFTNLTEFLDMIPDLNITNDPVLEQLRTEARNKLNFSMATVKQSAILKQEAANAAKSLIKKFGQSNRRIISGDNAAAA